MVILTPSPLPTDDTLNVVESAYAKINLYLHVTGKRENGYHDLDSLAVFAQIGDLLDVCLARGQQAPSLKIEGPFSKQLEKASGEDINNNLIIKAAKIFSQALFEKTRILHPVTELDITLQKNLPIASGIGGGSADAAALLRALYTLWEGDKAFSLEEMLKIAKAVGADVPVCYRQQAVRMEGIGEILTKAPILPECGIMLVNPCKAVSTPLVFQTRKQEFSSRADLPLGWGSCDEMVDFLRGASNDLQESAVTLEPSIAEVLNFLQGIPKVKFVRMSGSGATCFALFGSEKEAKEGRKRLSGKEWWSWAGSLCI